MEKATIDDDDYYYDDRWRQLLIDYFQLQSPKFVAGSLSTKGLVSKGKDFLSKISFYQTLRFIKMYLHNTVLSDKFFHPTNFFSVPTSL